MRLRQVMKEAQKLEIAERIRDLRERSPFTQPIVADKLGVRLRSYQRLEERGTTKWERVEQLARIFDADPYWIWEGKERGKTPDPFASQAARDRLDHIEAMLIQLLDHFELEAAEREADEFAQQHAPGDQPGEEDAGGQEATGGKRDV